MRSAGLCRHARVTQTSFSSVAVRECFRTSSTRRHWYALYGLQTDPGGCSDTLLKLPARETFACRAAGAAASGTAARAAGTAAGAAGTAAGAGTTSASAAGAGPANAGTDAGAPSTGAGAGGSGLESAGTGAGAAGTVPGDAGTRGDSAGTRGGAASTGADAARKPLPVPTWIVAGQSINPEAWECAAVLIDKPQGWTSFDVVAKLRGAIRIKRVGHAGTLDPMATGLLVVLTGRATKLQDSLMASDKEYTGTLRLGESTPSYDADTPVSLSRLWSHITDEQLQSAAAEFVGSCGSGRPCTRRYRSQAGGCTIWPGRVRWSRGSHGRSSCRSLRCRGTLGDRM
eukprot:jgi/Botrbrau1/20493/Bobra.145_2s0052.1